MSAPVISSLPIAPQRTDLPAVFSTRADAFVAALQPFRDELNTLGSWMNETALEVAESALIAANAAILATEQVELAEDQAEIAILAAQAAVEAKDEAEELVERYQGALAEDPLLNKYGEPLISGDWYISTVTGFIRAYNGDEWVNGLTAISGVERLNGETGHLEGFTENDAEQTLTNKTIVDPVLKLDGSDGELGQVPIAQGHGLPIVWGSVKSLGAGGAVATDSVILTAESPALVSITVDKYGHYVKLPDATECVKGVTTFAVNNNSAFPVVIKNHENKLLGFVDSFSTVVSGLADNDTAAGVWALAGHKLIGQDAEGTISSTGAPNINRLMAISLDENRDIIFFRISTDTRVEAVIYDNETAQFGPVVLIQAAAQVGFMIDKIDENSVLFISANSISGAARVIQTSGTTITVNASSDWTLTASHTGNGNLQHPVTCGRELLKVGSSWIFGYANASDVYFHAVTVSGTTPSVGSSQTMTGNQSELFWMPWGSDGFLGFSRVSETLHVRPFTVSGNTLTARTAGSTNLSTAGGSNNMYTVRAVGNRWLVVSGAGGSPSSVVMVYIIGTTAMLSSQQTLFAPFSSTPSVQVACHVVGNQMIIVARERSGSSSMQANVASISSGSLVVGTAITSNLGASNVSSGSFGAVMLGTSEDSVFVLSADGSQVTEIAISGNNPSVRTIRRNFWFQRFTGGSIELYDYACANGTEGSPGTIKYPFAYLEGESGNTYSLARPWKMGIAHKDGNINVVDRTSITFSVYSGELQFKPKKNCSWRIGANIGVNNAFAIARVSVV